MTGAAFVLRPLADLAPDWRHPVTGQAIAALMAALPADQIAALTGCERRRLSALVMPRWSRV